MRIGLLTFHQGTNYGGILQCYATHKLLEAHGHEVEEIVIEKELPNLRSRIYNKLRTLESPKQLFKVFIDLINKKKNKSTINNTESNLLLSVFDAFRDQYLHLSPKQTIYSIGEYANKHYDVIIVGSDQVWTDIFDKNSIYFLGWTPNFKGKKIALAACSAHNNVDQKRKKELKPLLKSFSTITVRDNTTANLVECITEKRPAIIGDPSTFYDYHEFITNKKEDPFILVYILGIEIKGGHTLAIEKIRKYYGNISVKLITVGKVTRSLASICNEIITDSRPEDWVDLISKATCVYTDSFHAILFSMKFQRPFIAYYTESIRASRLIYLKEHYDLHNIVDNAENINFENIQPISKDRKTNIIDILAL